MSSADFVGVAEAAPHRGLETFEVLCDFVAEAVGPAADHVGTTSVGRDGETVRHRETENRCHLRQVGAFASEQATEFAWGLGMGKSK